MVTANAIQQILSGPGAITQDFDGSFFVLTNRKTENRHLTTKDSSSQINPKLFTPGFFEITPVDLQNFENCIKIERKLLIEALNAAQLNEAARKKPPWVLQDRALFDEDFSKIQSAIREGLIDKAVVMTRETRDWVPSNRERQLMLLNLLERCPRNLFIYGHWTEDSGVLGATPEILFRRSGKTIHTMALAGTLPKTGSPNTPVQANDLLEDPKELFEHQLVVDDLTEKLDDFATQLKLNRFSLKLQGPEVIELPHLFHLHTRIQGEFLNPIESENFDSSLIEKLHPSSALGLRSKITHWHWLKALHGHQNLGHFGAPVGFNHPEGYLCLVGIRNLEWHKNQSFLRAGCGIVSQSNSDREWQELRAKRESVKALLGLNDRSGE